MPPVPPPHARAHAARARAAPAELPPTSRCLRCSFRCRQPCCMRRRAAGGWASLQMASAPVRAPEVRVARRALGARSSTPGAFPVIYTSALGPSTRRFEEARGRVVPRALPTARRRTTASTLWLGYAEMEMRNRRPARPAVWDRAVAADPRIDQFKYIDWRRSRRPASTSRRARARRAARVPARRPRTRRGGARGRRPERCPATSPGGRPRASTCCQGVDQVGEVRARRARRRERCCRCSRRAAGPTSATTPRRFSSPRAVRALRRRQGVRDQRRATSARAASRARTRSFSPTTAAAPAVERGPCWGQGDPVHVRAPSSAAGRRPRHLGLQRTPRLKPTSHLHVSLPVHVPLARSRHRRSAPPSRRHRSTPTGTRSDRCDRTARCRSIIGVPGHGWTWLQLAPRVTCRDGRERARSRACAGRPAVETSGGGPVRLGRAPTLPTERGWPAHRGQRRRRTSARRRGAFPGGVESSSGSTRRRTSTGRSRPSGASAD